METSTILTADVLDILFDGRNKEYGAYDLRRTYNKRLAVSITVMLSATAILFVGLTFAGKKEPLAVLPDVTDIALTAVKQPEEPVKLPPPPPPPKAPAPQAPVQMKQFTTVRIVNTELIPENEKPPVVEDLDHFKIGLQNKTGEIDGNLAAPPVADGNGQGIIQMPQKEDKDEDQIFLKVEIESAYPGGAAAWQRFLYKNLHYPQEAVDQNIQGFVLVQFIVDREGNVSNVEAVSGPEELRAEAVRVIKKSGKWSPAIQNSKKVKSYKRQPIGFKLAEE